MAKGYQITFFAEQERRHGHTPLGDWLLEFAREHGAIGGSLVGAAEGFGAEGRMRSTHLFDLAEQPVVVTVSLPEAAADRLLAALGQEAVSVFYIKLPMEYGRVGSAPPPSGR